MANSNYTHQDKKRRGRNERKSFVHPVDLKDKKKVLGYSVFSSSYSMDKFFERHSVCFFPLVTTHCHPVFWQHKPEILTWIFLGF